jgi:hypothetical protein
MPVLDDQDVTTKIPVGGPNQFLIKLLISLSKAVFLNDVTYKLI